MTDAKKFENKELPPTKAEIHSLGITPLLLLLEPSKNPAAKTPAASSGIICFVNPHVSPSHWFASPSVKVKAIVVAITATTKVIAGLS